MPDPITQCVIGRANKQVRLQINGADVGLSWSMALELSRILVHLGKAARQYSRDFQAGKQTITVDKEHLGPITLHVSGPALIVELNNKPWFACNYRTVGELTRAVRQQAQAIEEEAKAPQIIADQALLLRTPLGALVGLSDNPKIQQAAWKAAEDVKLPGVMVEPTAIVGTPSILQSPPLVSP